MTHLWIHGIYVQVYVYNDVFLQWMSTFPALMWHRKAADILFPWVDLVSEEILDLKV